MQTLLVLVVQMWIVSFSLIYYDSVSDVELLLLRSLLVCERGVCEEMVPMVVGTMGCFHGFWK